MDSPVTDAETQDADNAANKLPSEEVGDLREQVLANLQKPNVPNVNVPERIIFCLDMGCDSRNSPYRLADGTTCTSINMFRRVIEFFLHSKQSINEKTQFALVLLKNVPFIMQFFTSNIRDILNSIDLFIENVGTWDTLDFTKLFQILKDKVDMSDSPQYKLPPPYVVRMIILYGRSNCVPVIPLEDAYFNYLKKHLYFYIDILFAHEEDCASHKCEEVFDALQDLDNGYSYIFEVSKNATKLHDCIAKLLAHPLQRPLQKNTNYTFGHRH